MVLQIDFQIKMDKNFAQIKGKKDIIETAQSRNHFLLRLQNIARFEVAILTLVDWSEEFLANPSSHPIFTLGSSILSESNKKLLQASSSLPNNEDHKRLFEKNVKIYGYSGENGLILTNFQAVDRIAQAIAHGINEIKAKEFSQAIESFTFIAKNCLSDLLLTGEETVRIFVNSLKDFINDIEAFLLARYYICLELLFLIFVIGALLLRAQYSRIKDNIAVFSSLDLANVKELLDNLVEFRQSIENEEYLEELQFKDLNQRQSTLILDPGRSQAKRTFRKINHQALTRKYFLYAVKLGILIGLLIGLLSKSKLLLRHKIVEIENKVAQVHYSSWILSQTYLCYVSLIELFSEEKLVMIRNQSPYDQAVESMKQVQGVIHKIAKGYFADHDSRYDEQVFKVLFENVCPKNETENDLLYFCQLPQNEGKTINFLNLISNIEYQTNQVLRDYSTSNQTIENFRKFIDQIGGFIFPTIYAQEYLNRHLSSRLSFLFQESVHISIELNALIGIYTGLGIVLTAGLVWFVVFRRIREADNEFKEMLSVFPVSLILQNFKLKNYLKETAASKSFGIFTNRQESNQEVS